MEEEMEKTENRPSNCDTNDDSQRDDLHGGE
jgi:hypothetical protein